MGMLSRFYDYIQTSNMSSVCEEFHTNSLHLQTSSQKGNDSSPESHYKCIGTFKMLKGSKLHSQWSYLAEI